MLNLVEKKYEMDAINVENADLVATAMVRSDASADSSLRQVRKRIFFTII